MPIEPPSTPKSVTRIERRDDKPDRKPPKSPPCITRLVVEDAEVQDTAFLVTVFNSGNLPSYHIRINVYILPVGGEPDDEPLLVGTGSTTLGILERKQISVIKDLGGASVANAFFAVVFDPINDPFPVRDVRQLYLQELNLLASGLQPDLPGWRQYEFANDRFLFNQAERVPDALRTWQLMTMADLDLAVHKVPANPSINGLLFPGETPNANSEFRYQVHIDNQFFLREIRKGNVTVESSCLLCTHEQTPRDRGGFWLRLSGLSGSDPVLIEPSLESPGVWIPKGEPIIAHPDLTTITVRLIAKLRKGAENNAYFANTRCALKHRQVKRARHA